MAWDDVRRPLLRSQQCDGGLLSPERCTRYQSEFLFRICVPDGAVKHHSLCCLMAVLGEERHVAEKWAEQYHHPVTA